VLAAAAGLPRSRVDEVLALVELTAAGARHAGGYSQGMRQRLGLAGALLGDPGVLVLDEPGNGLDPAGIAWLRQFLRGLAAEGRTVLISSHALGEVQQTVDDVVVIARGRLVRAGALADIESGPRPVLVASPEAARLADALPSGAVQRLEDGRLQVSGPTAAEVGHLAHELGVELHELSTAPSDLAQVFLQMTGEAS
jgi:ABC-2 type transport system ATP-binding protein